MAPSRKKSCLQCSESKTRCDLQRPSCGRCAARRFQCYYQTGPPTTASPTSQTDTDRNFSTMFTPTLTVVNPLVNPLLAVAASESAPEHNRATDSTTVDGEFGIGDQSQVLEAPNLLLTPHSYEDSSLTHHNPAEHQSSARGPGLDFQHLDLVATTDSARIRNRWLETFLPSPDQVLKNLQPPVVNFASRVLKSYPRMMLRKGGLPPIIHPLQVGGDNGESMPLPLANCFSLVRMWEGRVPGGEGIVKETVKKEMERLFHEHETYDQLDLLAAFQAYFLYTCLAFFSPIDATPLVDRSTMINLQELACQVSITGLVCKAELTHTRPSWESWIIASAKRRTLFAMYLLDNVYNYLHDIPTHVAGELGALPAPASKALWEARTRQAWEREYDLHLGTWDGGELKLGELWPPPEEEVERRRDRVDRWLQSVDEFGMMLFTTTSLIHGC